jgi:hypothetical protein
MTQPITRFLLSNDSEQGIDKDWYHLFEPTIELEIGGKQVIGEYVHGGVKDVIIFVFMEHALKLTERILSDLKSNGTKEYSYWFTGTDHGLRLRFHGKTFDVELITNPALGPVSDDALIHTPRKLGTIILVEWVQAIVRLGQELSDRFKSYPDSRTILKDQKSRILTLESWLRSMP